MMKMVTLGLDDDLKEGNILMYKVAEKRNSFRMT